MDLRKHVLMRQSSSQPLAEIALNTSNISIYDSANEDSDSDSIYYSFSETSFKNFDESSQKIFNNSNSMSEEHEHSLVSSPEDKNETVIKVEPAPSCVASSDELQELESDCDKENVQSDPVAVAEPQNEVETPQNATEDNAEIKIVVTDYDKIKEEPVEPEIDGEEIAIAIAPIPMEVDEPKVEILDDIDEPEDLRFDLSAVEQQEIEIKEEEGLNEIVIEAPVKAVEIVLEDPNKSLVNPFLLDDESPIVVNPFTLGFEVSPAPTSPSKMPQKKSLKKSATKIPTLGVKNHLYSPLQRTSIDRNTKIIIKPTAARRTIYETRSQATITKKPELPKPTKIAKPSPSTSTVASKVTKPQPKAPVVSKIAQSSAPKVPAKPFTAPLKRRPLPAPFKCTHPGCNREFRSGLAFQDHMKSHNNDMTTSSASTSSASLSSNVHKCKWCDKKFEIELALTTHMIESCTKISFAEKRKLIAAQERNKQANNNNKRKSMFAPPEPRKKSPGRRQTLVSRKSGVVTPKKTMKCHVDGCGQLFTDVLTFANHMVGHKYNGVIPPAAK